MDYLVFQLHGAMASWGEAAVGEYRGSHDHPGAAALAGLVAAALGLRRNEESQLAALRDQLLFAVAVLQSGNLLRDYHTAQVPGRSALKGRRHATRRDELCVPKLELNTILSTRDYRQDVHYVVAVQARAEASRSLVELAHALRQPQFVLYLGRKSCPPASPLHPLVIEASSVYEAVCAYQDQAAMDQAACVQRLAWADGMEAGVACDLSVVRKDRLIRRGAWQYGDRAEHIKLFDGQGG